MGLAGINLRSDTTPVVETAFGGETGTRPSEAVLAALAEADDVASTDLDPLYETIDMELLDRLFVPGDDEDTSSRVFGFTVQGWNVFLDDSGSVVVSDAE